jgi:hypothetical protein
MFGLEATFCRSVADTAAMTAIPSEEAQRVVTTEELEALQRRARQTGVSLAWVSRREHEPLSVLEQALQLEKKIQYVSDFASQRQAANAATPSYFDQDIDGVPYDPADDIDGVPLEGDDDIDGVPYDAGDDDIDGVPYDAGDNINGDIDGTPYDACEDDDIDGMPME